MRSWIRIVAAAASLLSLQLWAQNSANPVQVALLRWYQANSVTQFTTCATPQGLAFDRVHTWVACGGTGNKLEEFDSSDGTLVSTITGVSDPYALVYDGANVWATNLTAATVTKVSAATGTIVGTYTVGASPMGITFDGTNIWVTNSGGNSISKILATTGAVTTYSLSTCTSPWGAAFDGTYVWVVCHGSNKVVQLSATGAVLASVTVGAAPAFAAYDGETTQTNGPFLWVTNNTSNTVSKVSVANHTLIANYNVGTGPNGVVFDGIYVWVANGTANTVTKIYQSSGLVVGSFPNGVGWTLSHPLFVTFDGGNVWLSNSSGTTVSKF